VVTHTDPQDARRRTVRLTAEGLDLLKQAYIAMHPEATLGFEALDDDRLDDLVGLLSQVRARLDDARPDDARPGDA
jgi:DNA-binding MarR family transcriptional regulator